MAMSTRAHDVAGRAPDLPDGPGAVQRPRNLALHQRLAKQRPAAELAAFFGNNIA